MTYYLTNACFLIIVKMKHNFMEKKAFTLVEILITVTVITVLFAGVIALINPVRIIEKGNNTARKKDLDDAKKMLEEYMTDTGCYPQPTQICTEGTNTNGCHICTRGQSAPFSYFAKDICDPRHGGAPDYQYEIETVLQPKDVAHGIPVSSWIPATCPKWFRIYSILDGPYNADEDIWGCKKNGCGISPLRGYGYMVMSPGAPSTGYATSNWYCYANGDCTQCTPYENCITPGGECYGQELYAARTTCCALHDRSSPYCLGW